VPFLGLLIARKSFLDFIPDKRDPALLHCIAPVDASLEVGTGTFTLTESGLQYDITVRNLSSSLTAAHFHLGAAGVNGDILQSISFSGNRATGTWALTTDQRNAVLRGQIYVNVHTTNHPDGEIRGQVLVQ
jgi:hypothetical protein